MSDYKWIAKFGDMTQSQQVLIGMAKVLLEFVHEIIVRRGKPFDPILQFASKDKLETMKITELFTDELAHIKGDILRGVLAQAKADFYCLATEAWGLTGDAVTAEMLETIKQGDVAKHPNRISCLTITAESIKGDVFGATWVIQELEGGRRIDFQEPVVLSLYNRDDVGEETIFAEGAMVDLLAERRERLAMH